MPKRFSLLLSALIALLLAPAVTPPVRADLPELIPIEILQGNPSKARARLSPDGAQLAYLAPSEEDVLNVWIQTLGEDDARMLTHDTHRGIRIYSWSEDSRRILFLQDSGGDENWHVYSTDLETGVTRDLTPFQGIRATNLITDRKHPQEILVGLNLRTRAAFDMYRVDLETGAVILDTENPGDVIGWVTDPEFRIRAAFATRPADGTQVLRVRDGVDEPWRDLMEWPFDETGSAVDFAADGQSIYVESSLDSDTTRLLRVDVKSGEPLEVLAHDPRCDLGTIEIDESTHTPQAVSLDYLKPEWKVLDPAVEKDFARLGAALPGRFGIVSRDHADKTWIVYQERDNAPLAYFAYRRESGALERLFVDRPELEGAPLAEMKPVVITARDGLELVSYLTLPIGVEAKNLPLVLYVHGGPWARDIWGYHRDAQWLANRGYAVLQVNFRASTGFGKSFLNAGNGEWGQGAMQHDLTDAVRWAIEQGLADPEKIAIMGGSYGGYATLAGLTFTPELYACGVDIVGMSNMQTTIATIPPYWAPFKKLMLLRLGDVESDQDYNRRISPLFHAEKIQAPLLIGQGANDPRVKVAESDQIVEAMRANELPVTYVVYTDEGHGFARPGNNKDFTYRADRFLAECLGGRYEEAPPIEGTSADLR